MPSSRTPSVPSRSNCSFVFDCPKSASVCPHAGGKLKSTKPHTPLPPIPPAASHQHHRSGTSRAHSGTATTGAPLRAPRTDKAPVYSVPIDPQYLKPGTSHLKAALDTLSASLGCPVGSASNSNSNSGSRGQGSFIPHDPNLNSEGAPDGGSTASGAPAAGGSCGNLPEVEALVAHARRLNQPAAALASVQVGPDIF